MQIFPGGKLEEEDINSWQRAYLELREEGGQRLCDWLDSVLKADPERLLRIDEHCFAVEVRPDDDLDGEQEFVGLIKLAPEHRSIGWYSSSEVAKFEIWPSTKTECQKELKPFLPMRQGGLSN
ncbi:hypothetical protein EOM71_00315 [Candidatus Falkowbacteria bacterium]|nr:hypothetical protein [Candidatus Falkowbacteria bacterium]